MADRGIKIGGLHLLSPTTNPALFNLASWHHPRSLTWRWILAVYFRRPIIKPHFHAYSHGGPHWSRKWGFGTLWSGFNWGLSMGLGTILSFRISPRDVAVSVLGAELILTVQRNMWRKVVQ